MPSPNDFTDLIEVEQRLLAFQDRYNATARPFNWTFTAQDLHESLARLDAHSEIKDTPARDRLSTMREAA